jgi:fumarate hydratase class I
VHAIGGDARVLAERVVDVKDVHLAGWFVSPEAIRAFRVERFPAVVTMDSHGRSRHKQVLAECTAKLKQALS